MQRFRLDDHLLQFESWITVQVIFLQRTIKNKFATPTDTHRWHEVRLVLSLKDPVRVELL
jgi:hypothetical protein